MMPFSCLSPLGVFHALSTKNKEFIHLNINEVRSGQREAEPMLCKRLLNARLNVKFTLSHGGSDNSKLANMFRDPSVSSPCDHCQSPVS